MKLVLKTWSLITCLFLLLSGVGENAFASSCPDNFLSPPQEILPKDKRIIKDIFRDLHLSYDRPIKQNSGRNLKLIGRYRHLIAKDHHLAYGLLGARTHLRYYRKVEGSDDAAIVRQYRDLFDDIILQDITPLLIKPGKVTRESPNGFTIDFAYDDLDPYDPNASFSSPRDKVMNMFLSNIFTVSCEYKEWLASKTLYLKFDGEKFYFDKSNDGAITARKFKNQVERQRKLEYHLENLPLFLRV